jgi:glutathione S-transferase
MVPTSDALRFLRHKERKFGRGCLDQWRAEQKSMLDQLEQKLLPFEEMLMYHPFLLGERPRFVDFDLYGMLGNFLYSGHYRLPRRQTRLKHWYDRMTPIEHKSLGREKELHS